MLVAHLDIFLFSFQQNGDLNWIIRGRILAFAGPHFRRNVSPEGYCTLTPDDYIPYFKQENVDLVVRLNKRCYEEEEFIQADIRHYEQYYLDGSCPPIKILNRVLEAFETVPSDKAFAVHCKAGLGRTGTCIGAFMMKHYKFTAAEAIGWMRICRPGMVIGPQQHFLQDIEQRMWHEGSVMTLKPTQDVKLLRITESTTTSKVKGSPKSVVMGAQSSLHFGELGNVKEAETDRDGQAEGLLARRNQGRR
jgi:protein-tyrosine phosphatase